MLGSGTPAPIARSTVGTTSSGARRAASGTQNTPSGKSSTSSAAIWSARRVLPTPPWTGECDEARAVANERRELFELGVSPHEWRRLNREVGRVQRAKRREDGVAELVEALRLAQILESMAAEIDQRAEAAGSVHGLLREHDLAAVRRRADPGTAVDVQSDIALGSDFRFARVDPDADTDRCAREARLCLLRGGQCVTGSREGGEELVSPCASTSTPPYAQKASRRMRRCSARTSAYRSPNSRRRRVDLPMSVNTKVTSGGQHGHGSGRMLPVRGSCQPQRSPGRCVSPGSRRHVWASGPCGTGRWRSTRGALAVPCPLGLVRRR